MGQKEPTFWQLLHYDGLCQTAREDREGLPPRPWKNKLHHFRWIKKHVSARVWEKLWAWGGEKVKVETDWVLV